MHDRRAFLGMTGAVALAGAGEASAQGIALEPGFDRAMGDFASAQATFGRLYDIDRTIANFDAAYYGAMTRPVQAIYAEKVGWVNRVNALYLRSAVPGHPRDAELDRSRAEVAGLLGCKTQEIALSTGGTEALYALITNYRLLKAGDAVLLADVDYDEMQYAMEYLKESRGAEVVRFDLPEPMTRANILSAYDRILRDTPRAKLLLLTHLSNRNGLVPPVREIVAMAKARGVDVILDSAQTVGHLDFTVADTGADFIGFSLHKWLAAPLGNGGIYIREGRLGDIAPYLGNRIHDESDIRARVPTGTADIAARLTIPAAVAMHRAIGPKRKLAHLRALRDHWIAGVREVKGLQLMLPDEPDNHGSVSAFRLPGQRDWAQAQAVQKLFLDKYRLLVVAKRGLASGPVLRVTPALFNTTAELDRLIAAIQAERGLFA
ncbi:aminotransferase class V-fold PLP-dependent enzyme [Sphingomonas naphthae]|uniref:Aminotransferase class V-fold PLP-dependent enzyme n=1 Tax=Sphingomonas naphthae TaxID=1813468 RepID=A0ABY7TNU5_9SPHN|nr:aminotransferase class V-fold PLP-dependent enzyme [Sphingomonas naphthae]WCT74912.1 aminotransferase class V-fold PLP-dependent enzyme [Sphingomonas naphthae]